MSEELQRVRCVQCELVQWANRVNCRRCGQKLPAPVFNVVERVVGKVIIRKDPACLDKLEQACRLITAASDRLQQPPAAEMSPASFTPSLQAEVFPSLEEMERTMIVAAYERANRRPVEATRLLGIGKTTFYRKLKEIGHAAA